MRTLGAISIVIVGCTSLKAVVMENSPEAYRDIPKRNAFGLKQPQITIQTPPSPTLPKLILTGITTILGNKLVLLKTQPPAGKPGDQLSLILTEGQREEGVEVLQIDEKTGAVKVNNSGTVMTLTFEKDGPKIPSAATAPGAVPFPLGTNPAFTTGMPTGNPAVRSFAVRNLRAPGASGAAVTAAPGTAPGTSPYQANVPSAPASFPPATANQPQDLSLEEQTILLEIQRQANKSNPNYAPLPPTALTQGAAQGANSAPPPILPR